MILRNVKNTDGETRNFVIERRVINNISLDNPCTSSTIDITFENGSHIYPGLINSHDHLDFNLFPPLGNYIYKNYLEWGNDIHLRNKDIINNVLNIPKPLRTQWGVYKNLISGITTVVQHGEKLLIPDKLITILSDCISLHSTALEKYWKYKLNNPFGREKKFVIHTGEGTDAARHKEIDELIKWNFFKRNLTGIHGVAMNEEQSKHFSALVWCPVSNYFLLNATANIKQLKRHTKILFGTDSTVSADWNIWNHLRFARRTGMLADEELFHTLTTSPANVWLGKQTELLQEDNDADIIIVNNPDKQKSGMGAFFSTNPEDIQMIIHKGEIVLFDQSVLLQLQQLPMHNFSCFYIANKKKYVKGNLPHLVKQIRKHLPDAKLPIDVD